MNVIPNATLGVLRELTGDGAARQALRVVGYVSTSDRIVPETADFLLNTDAGYLDLVKTSLEIIGQLDPAEVVPDIIRKAFKHADSQEKMLNEVAKARGLNPKSDDIRLRVSRLLTAIGSPDLVIEQVADDPERATVANYLIEQAKLAHGELMNSLKETIEKGPGNNSGYTHSAERRGDEVGTYETFGDGIKVHLETGDLHLQGLEVSRHVTSPGEYKVVKSAAKTLAKNELRHLLPLSKWRQLVLRRGKFQEITIRGRRFGPEDFEPPTE